MGTTSCSAGCVAVGSSAPLTVQTVEIRIRMESLTVEYLWQALTAILWVLK